MSSSSSSSSGGIGFVGLLQIAFIVLKLTNYIGWPWWQVMLPTLVSSSVVLLLIIAIGIFYLVRR